MKTALRISLPVLFSVLAFGASAPLALAVVGEGTATIDGGANVTVTQATSHKFTVVLTVGASGITANAENPTFTIPTGFTAPNATYVANAGLVVADGDWSVIGGGTCLVESPVVGLTKAVGQVITVDVSTTCTVGAGGTITLTYQGQSATAMAATPLNIGVNDVISSSPVTLISAPPTITVTASEACTGTVGTSVFVSTSGNDSNNGSESCPLKTIQAAVTAAASGATIHVAAGTYTEQINVGGQYDLTKYLTIKGSNTSISAGSVPGTRTTKTIINGGFRLWGGSSVIDGFTIQGGFIMSGAAHSGIVVGSANGGSPNVTIENNIIQNSVGSQSNGIEVVAGSTNLQILNNEVVNNWRGIFLNPTSGITISGNYIHANNGSGVGIGSDGQSNLTISGNTISNQIEGWGSGTVGANVVAHNNSFIENTKGVAWYSGSTINATNNWWGSSVLATVQSQVNGIAQVTVTPYYTTSTTGNSGILSDIKAITAFSFASPAATGVISGTNIAVSVPAGTDVTALTPAVTMTGVSVSPLSETPQNFSSPVTYTVTAIDGTTQAYTVTVTILAPTVVYVDTSKLDSNNGLTADTAKKTIQAGISLVASGGTVNVSEGTYYEDIQITKPLTIDGAGPNLTILDGHSATENYYMVRIEADNVTVKDLAITNPLYSGSADASGILTSNAGRKSNLHVTNVKIHDIGTLTRPAPNGTYGINVGPVNGLEIDHSEIYNIGNGSADGEAVGILTWGNNSTTQTAYNINIHDNNVHDITNSVASSGIRTAVDSTNVTIDTNTVTGPFKTGGIVTSPSMAGPATITNNTVTGASAIGILLRSPFAQTVTGNTISGATVGIQVNATVTLAPTINSNSISGNTTGLKNLSGNTVDVTENWWGSAIESAILSKISGSLSYSPWYSDSLLTNLKTTTTLDENNNRTTTLPSALPLTGSDDGVTVTADIPAGTTITGDSTWNGVIAPPTATTQNVIISGFDTTVTSAISVGSSLSDLTFDKAVKLTFADQKDKLIGWYNHANVFTEITATCSGGNDEASQTTSLGAGASCKMNVGNDLVVWTKHFSTFTTYTQTPVVVTTPPSSHGGGGGEIACTAGTAYNPSTSSCTPVRATPATPAVPGVSPAVPATPATPSINSNGNANGRVLGAATFNFGQNLGVGSQGADVTALQQFLIDGGFSIPAGATGYYGAQTRAAVIAFQKARGIDQAGVVGPLTRAELNKGVTPTATNLTSVQADAIISIIESFGADASVVARVRASLGR